MALSKEEFEKLVDPDKLRESLGSSDGLNFEYLLNIMIELFTDISKSDFDIPQKLKDLQVMIFSMMVCNGMLPAPDKSIPNGAQEQALALTEMVMLLLYCYHTYYQENIVPFDIDKYDEFAEQLQGDMKIADWKGEE